MYVPLRIYVRIRIFISHPLAPTALKSGDILKGVYWNVVRDFSESSQNSQLVATTAMNVHVGMLSIHASKGEAGLTY